MSLTLTKQPSKQITATGGNLTSKWNAAHNPIWFEFIRKDYPIVDIKNSSVPAGLMTAHVTGVIPIPAGSVGGYYQPVDEYMYVNTPNYKGTYKILSIQQLPGTSTVVFSSPYISDDLTGGYMNDLMNRKNYKVDAQIIKVDLITAVETVIDTRSFQPGPDGVIKINVESAVRAMMSFKNGQDYSATLYNDLDAACAFKIATREIWNGNLGSSSTDVLLQDDFKNDLNWIFNYGSYVDTVNEKCVFPAGILSTIGAGSVTLISSEFYAYSFEISSYDLTSPTSTAGTITIKIGLTDIITIPIDASNSTPQTISGTIAGFSGTSFFMAVTLPTGVVMNIDDFVIKRIPFLPSDVFYAIQSAKQIQEKNGSNLGEYVPTATDIGHKSKFISPFKQPVYWPAFPFDFGFIASELIKNAAITMEQIQIKEGGSQITQVNNGFTTTTVCEGRLKLRAVSGYNSAAKYLDVWLRINSIEQERYVDQGYVADDYHQVIPDAPADLDPFDLTEVRRFEIDRACVDNPVFLRWKATAGGWGYWLFGYDYKDDLLTNEESTYNNFESDIETSQGATEVWSKSSADDLSVGCNRVKAIHHAGLKSLFESPKVQMLMNPDTWATDGAKWQNVRIKTKSFPVNVRSEFFEIKLTLSQQERNTLTQ